MILLDGKKQDVDALAFSPEGKQLAVGGTASHVQLWDLETRTVRKVLGPKGPHLAVAFLPEGRLMTATKEARVRIEEEGRIRESIHDGGGGQISFISAAATASGDAVVACGQRHYSPWLVCLSSSGLEQRWERNRLDGQPFRLRACPGGLIAVATDHRCYLIYSTNGATVRQVGSYLQFVPALAVSPDGRFIAIGAGMELLLFDPSRGVRIASTRITGRKQFTDAAFDPSGRFLLTSSNDQTVRLWSVPDLKQTAAFDWEIGPVRRVAFAPDGMRAAAAGKTGKVVVWDVDR